MPGRLLYARSGQTFPEATVSKDGVRPVFSARGRKTGYDPPERESGGRGRSAERTPMGAGEEAAVLGRPPLVAVLNRLPTATEGGTVFGSQGKPRTARFLLLCSAIASEALKGYPI